MASFNQSFIKAYSHDASAAISTTTSAAPAVAHMPSGPHPAAAQGRLATKSPRPAEHGGPPSPHARFPVPAAAPAEDLSTTGTLPLPWTASISTLDAMLLVDAPAPPARPATAARPTPPPASPTVFPASRPATWSPSPPAFAPPEPDRQPPPPRREAAERGSIFHAPDDANARSSHASRVLQPMLEVDRLHWPEMVDTVLHRAASHLGSLVDSLFHASASGRKVLLFMGERHGAGVSTLTAAAAKRLADLGLRVALVDGDLNKAMLGRSLGVAAQQGWDDVLCGRAELADVLVEAIVDRITLLPLASTLHSQIKSLDVRRPSADLATLREQFDIVLVDGGALPAQGQPHLFHMLTNATLDGTILVRDLRHGGDEAPLHAHPLRERIESLQLGVVENFATGA